MSAARFEQRFFRGAHHGPTTWRIFLVIAGMFVAALVIVILFLIMLQRALSRVSLHNQLMEPALVWRMFIPVFNLFWQLVIAIRLSDSLRKEFRERGRDDGSDYGKSLGLTTIVLGLVSANSYNLFNAIGGTAGIAVGLFSSSLGLVGLVGFIVLWLKIARYSARLAVDDRYRPESRGDYDDDCDNRDQAPATHFSPHLPLSSCRPEDPGHCR